MQASGSLSASWSEDECLAPLETLLDPDSTSIRVVSFDFFDTLICRLCADPADLFIEVGRRLAARGDLLVPLSPTEFKSARIAADEKARDLATQKKQSSEVTLTDIYAQLGNVVRDPQSARALEFEIERAFCHANPATVDLARSLHAQGVRTAIVSDTYFTRAELETLLRDNGVDPSLFSVILASSELGRAKWNGRLYHDLLRHFDVHASEVLHLGDNLHADIHCARQYGIEAVHYYKTTPHLDVVFNGERQLQGTNLEASASLQSLRTLAARRFADPTDPARDGALVFGPVLARYADWCVERFQQSGVKVVLALMREGAVLGELVERAAAQEGVELTVIPCFVSRLSTARAALSEVTPRKAAELLEGTPYVTPQAILDILGIGDEAGRCLDAETLKKPLGTGEAIAGFLTLLFKLPRIRDLLEQRRAESHSLAFDYLAGLIGDATHVGVIDLGWSGSIQRNVARILRRGGRDVRTLGCYLACTRRAGRLALEGDLALGFLERDWSRSTILP
ncbi:MAG: HAD-IA family hydrolase, partial [Verrucomicrobiales bacterium]|nr:HAD-IA family hydrolase [Verrucomicrobiales bacterium]